MVSYQAWTSIVFDVAEEKGAEIDGIGDGAPIVSLAAEVWNDRKEELQTATRAEARQIARTEVSVA